MKTKLFILGAFTLVMATTACKKESATDLYTEQEVADQANNVVDPATAPAMTLAEATHDFGDVKANEKVQAYVKFTNSGKAPLIIQDASATCGCTVPEFPKTPIAVGATDSIKVEYTAGNMNGKQQKTVTLVTNTANGTEQFNISANVVGASEPAQNAQQAFGQ